MRRLHLSTAGAIALVASLVVTRTAHAQAPFDPGALPPPSPAGSGATGVLPQATPQATPTTTPGPEPASPPADPDKLFTDAMNLIAQEKYDAAIPLLEEAQRIDPGIGTQFNLAVCYARTQRLALAWKNFRQVETLARTAGKKERADAARAKLDELRPHVRSISVQLAAGATASVSVDGELLPASELAFIPLDPGEHRIDVTAPGRTPFEKLILITDADGEHQDVVVPALAPLVTRTEIRTVTEETTNTRRTLGYVFGSVGLAGVAAATVTGILILSDKSTADERCKPDCVTSTGEVDATGADAVQRGRTLLPINIVSWVVAGAGLGAGAFFLITSRKQAPQAAQAARTTILPTFDARGGASAVLTTTF